MSDTERKSDRNGQQKRQNKKTQKIILESSALKRWKVIALIDEYNLCIIIVQKNSNQ